MFRQDLSQPFRRTMDCSSSELAGCLLQAYPDAHLNIALDAVGGSCRARFADGELLIEWRVLEPRQIALLSVPQLDAGFTYNSLDLKRREAIQTCFDRATQHGGV